MQQNGSLSGMFTYYFAQSISWYSLERS